MKRVGPVLIVLLAATWPSPSRAAQGANPRAVALSHFEDRVKAYVALRDKAKASLAPPRPTGNPQDILARQAALAAAVRAARAEAKAGDIFVPDIVPSLRVAIREDLERRTPGERAAVLREVPEGLALKVNDTYPQSVPLATVPPNLLAEMPRLPEGLEYRFVGRRLILHDTVTNLVVDILDEALPGR